MNKQKIEKYIPYLILISVAIFLSMKLFIKDFNIMIDDGIQHISRIIENYIEISKGNLYPEIFSRMCNNFGYSWNIFYGPLTAFLPLIFKLITNSFITAMKIYLLITLIASGITMYKFLSISTKNKYIGILGGVLYMSAPYHLTDMYNRLAVAEFTSFVFIPLVFLGLWSIFNEEKKRKICLIIGATGLILTHIISTIIVAIFSIIYIAINYKKLKDKEIIKSLLISTLFTIVITAFYTFPMLEHKNATSYEVFVENRMGTIQIYEIKKISPLQLFIREKEEFHFELGFVTIFGLILTPIALMKMEKGRKKEYIFSLILGILCLIFTLDIFPINFGKLSTIIQFPWRFLEFSTFFLSIIAAINFGIIIKNFKFSDVVIISIIAVLLSLYSNNEIYTSNEPNENDLIQGVNVTSDTGRVHAGCASFEYLPSKAFENRWYIEQRKDEIYILEGSPEISNYKKEKSILKCNIKTKNETTKIELPYIFYLGYEVKLKTNQEEKILDTFETDYGFVGAYIPENVEGELKVEYKGTNLMKISKIISILGIISLILLKIRKNVIDKIR